MPPVIKTKRPDSVNTLRARYVRAGQSLAVVQTNCRADRGNPNSLLPVTGPSPVNQIITNAVSVVKRRHFHEGPDAARQDSEDPRLIAQLAKSGLRCAQSPS